MIDQRQFPNPTFAALPTMYDLPSEDGDEPVLSDAFYLSQPVLLDATLRLLNYPVEALVTACDVSLYYDPRHDFWHNRPDWSLYLDLNREDVVPFLVVQLLAPSPGDADRQRRMQVMGKIGKPLLKPEMLERDLDGHYYVVFDRHENQLWVFEQGDGCYRSVELFESRFWFDELALGLGVWSGRYAGTTGEWLRWYDGLGDWVLTADERAEQATQQVEQERDRADEAQLKADRLAAKLRSLGIDPEAIG
jgi:Putative restriction endonuclease